MTKHITFLMAVLTASLLGSTRINQHYLHLELNPDNHHILARDKILAKTSDGYWIFYLSDALTIQRLTINDKIRKFTVLPNGDEDDMTSVGKKYSVKKRFLESSEQLLDITYSGVLYQDAGEASFSREKIAMEVNGTISESGIFLSPAAEYYPISDETLTRFETVVKLPPGWDAVSEGAIVKSDKNNEFTEVHFKTEQPVDGVYITAAKWIVQKKTVDKIDFYTYFFAEDTSLAREYLGMSIDYVKMYSQMLSPYPFSKFAVVENFFPTGYGMPSYTVLGKSVVNLPFIVYTSLGHEVLHNWWGNSVFVGDGGNWCEGLTAYMADYYYKLQKSEADARQYRKDILKDYTVYVNEENDFSPSAFIGRTDMVTRTIGYGKIGMIFHMLEAHIGRDNFIMALQAVIQNHQFAETSFGDFISAFETVSGEDLQSFKHLWFDEPGNPKLKLAVDADGYHLQQQDEIKPLWVPVRYQLASGDVIETIVFSNSASVDLKPSAASELIKIEVDPDFDIMRKLDQSEMDATIRHILSAEQRVFVVPEKNEDWLELARSYNGYIADGDDLQLYLPGEDIPDQPVIYLGVLPSELSGLVSDHRLNIYGQSFDSQNNSFVWAYKQNSGIYALALYSGNPKELAPLARKIPHYGKYGYLVFEHGNNVLKGNHEPDKSPLVWQK